MMYYKFKITLITFLVCINTSFAYANEQIQSLYNQGKYDEVIEIVDKMDISDDEKLAIHYKEFNDYKLNNAPSKVLLKNMNGAYDYVLKLDEMIHQSLSNIDKRDKKAIIQLHNNAAGVPSYTSYLDYADKADRTKYGYITNMKNLVQSLDNTIKVQYVFIPLLAATERERMPYIIINTYATQVIESMVGKYDVNLMLIDTSGYNPKQIIEKTNIYTNILVDNIDKMPLLSRLNSRNNIGNNKHMITFTYYTNAINTYYKIAQYAMENDINADIYKTKITDITDKLVKTIDIEKKSNSGYNEFDYNIANSIPAIVWAMGYENAKSIFIDTLTASDKNGNTKDIAYKNIINDIEKTKGKQSAQEFKEKYNIM